MIEVSGSDSYVTGGHSLGSSSGHGAGWFQDYRGEDDYAPGDSRCIAHVDDEDGKPWRTGIPGVAVFVDLGQQERKGFPDFVLRRRSQTGGSFFPVHGSQVGLGGGYANGFPALTDEP